MREVKFRAWEPSARKMHHADKTDCLADEPLLIGFDGAVRQICDATYRGSECGHFIKDQPALVLMQFTGLKDKNGVEIYEGDIINNGTGYLFAMEWDEGTMEPFGAYFETPAAEWSVVGNIHQNPELLKAA